MKPYNSCQSGMPIHIGWSTRNFLTKFFSTAVWQVRVRRSMLFWPKKLWYHYCKVKTYIKNGNLDRSLSEPDITCPPQRPFHFIFFFIYETETANGVFSRWQYHRFLDLDLDLADVEETWGVALLLFSEPVLIKLAKLMNRRSARNFPFEKIEIRNRTSH